MEKNKPNCGGVSQYARYILLFVNVVLLIFGIDLIVMGISLYLRFQKIYTLHITFCAICFPLGTFVIIVAAIGAYGTMKKRQFLLRAYGNLLLALCLIHMLVAILLRVTQGSLEAEAFRLERNFKENGDMSGYNQYEIAFACCGHDDYHDYDAIRNLESGYPHSCCTREQDYCFKPHEVGCAKAFAFFINVEYKRYIAIFVILSIIHFATSVFLCVMDNKKET